MAEGNPSVEDALLSSRRRLFYTNETNRTYQQQPQRQGCRNSLPGISLTSLTRAFTSRSSWNGSNAALLHLHQGNSRKLESLPGYVAKKYHVTTANSREQVWTIQLSRPITRMDLPGESRPDDPVLLEVKFIAN